MKQEDYNAIMKFPWETKKSSEPSLKCCPSCGEPYMGDGSVLCLDCCELTEDEQKGVE